MSWWARDRIRALTVIGFAVVLVGTTAWLGWHVLTVKNELEAAQAALSADGDTGAKIEAIGAHAAIAADAATDPIWRAAEFLPIVGDNLRAVRLAAEATSVVVNTLALPVFATGDDPTADEQPTDEGLLTRAIPVMQAAAPAVSAATAELSAAAASPVLFAPVAEAVDTLLPVLSALDDVVRVAPSLLGVDRPMHYLLVFQNNAESLPLGGSAASQTMISADNGALSIVKQANSGSFKVKPSVDVDVDQSAIDLYSNYLVSRVNTSVARPDFATAAAILRAFWNRDIDDTPIDGVISIDPLVLPGILDSTGPLKAGDITLTSDNVVQVLLSEAYTRWGTSDKEAKKADTFFAKVAAKLFTMLANGEFSPVQMATSLASSADRGDILLSIDDPTVEELISGTRMSGIMPTDNSTQTVVGTYFFDHSGGSKIDYYMDSAVSLTRTCDADTAHYETSTTLHLNLTQEVADTLPVYVNSKNWGSQKTRTGVYVYGPPGTTVESVSLDGREITVRSTEIDDLGRPVAAFDIDLAPDETGTVTARFTGAIEEHGPLDLWTTPMVNPTTITVDDRC